MYILLVNVINLALVFSWCGLSWERENWSMRISPRTDWALSFCSKRRFGNWSQSSTTLTSRSSQKQLLKESNEEYNREMKISKNLFKKNKRQEKGISKKVSCQMTDSTMCTTLLKQSLKPSNISALGSKILYAIIICLIIFKVNRKSCVLLLLEFDS